jgi:iron complex outermembrane recepter protein
MKVTKAARQSIRLSGSASFAALAICFTATQAQAQQSANDTAQGQSAGLEEIVVTAQRRSENLQKVPVSVSAVTSDALASAGIRNGADLGRIVPALSVFTTSGAVQPFLRGVGTPSSLQGYESSVAVYVDDTYISRVPPSLLELSSIERVEVLKGPQGTLFGRNASSGLIRIITRDPSHDPVLEGSLGLSNYGTFRGTLYASTGITSNLAVDVSGLITDQADGWGRNFGIGGKWGKDTTKAARTKVKWEPTSTTSVILSADYTHSRNSFIANSQYNYGPYRGYSEPPYGLQPRRGFYDIETNDPPIVVEENYGFSGKIAQDLSFGTLSSITTYRKDTGYNVFDSDFSSQPFLRADLYGFTKTFTQELQLASRKSSDFTWIAGLYYLNSRAGYLPSRFTGDGIDVAAPLLGLPAGTHLVSDTYAENRNKSYAGYAQATYHVTPTTGITLGARYTKDDIAGVGSSQIYPVGGTPFTLSTVNESSSFKKFTYKAAIDQQVTPDVLVYVSQSRGYKAGLYNTLPVNNTPAKPEVLDATEIGVKSELFDRKLRLNAAGFYYKLHDAQFQQFNGPTVQVINAKSARIWGAEIDGVAVLARGLQLRFSGGYLDTKYTSFTNAQTPVPNPNTDPALGPVGGYLDNLAPYDASGNRIVRAPKWTANIGANYELETSAGNFNFDVNYSYTGNFYWDADNVLKQPGYGLLDAQIKYTFPQQERFSVRLWAKNLTKREYYVAEIQSSGARGSSAMPGAPRTYGFDWLFNF